MVCSATTRRERAVAGEGLTGSNIGALGGVRAVGGDAGAGDRLALLCGRLRLRRRIGRRAQLRVDQRQWTER